MSEDEEVKYKPPAAPKITATTVSFGLMRWVLPIVFGGGIAWAMVRDLPKEQERLSAKQETQAVTLNAHDKKIALIEQNIGHILTGIKEIKRRIPHGRRSGRSGRHESPGP